MNDTKEINTDEVVLVAENGYTHSHGVGMGDSGGYPTVYLNLLSMNEAVETKAKDDTVRIFAVKEMEFGDLKEYKKYLDLKNKYGEPVWRKDPYGKVITWE